MITEQSLISKDTWHITNIRKMSQTFHWTQEYQVDRVFLFSITQMGRFGLERNSFETVGYVTEE